MTLEGKAQAAGERFGRRSAAVLLQVARTYTLATYCVRGFRGGFVGAMATRSGGAFDIIAMVEAERENADYQHEREAQREHLAKQADRVAQGAIC